MDNLIFVHGWATDSWVWEGTAKALSGSGKAVLVDLPGHGGEIPWDAPTFQPAVDEIKRHASTIDDGSAIGIGWSLGAQALIASFRELRHKFKGLILIGATPCFTQRDDFPYGQSKALVKRMIIDMKTDTPETINRFYGLNFGPEEAGSEAARSFVDRYRHPGPVVCSEERPGCFPKFKYGEIITALEALYSVDLRPEVRTLSVPTLIIHGEADTVTPVQAGRYLANSTRVANIEIYEGAGHAPFLTMPERFNKMATDFISIL